MFTVVLSSYGIAGHFCLAFSHNTFNVSINPQTTSARIGNTFSINITVSNVSASGLWAYEFKLRYNNSVLEALSAMIPPDHFLEPTLSQDGMLVIDPGTINQTEGAVSFAATLAGLEPGKTGSGTLANITFVAKTSGKSSLGIGGYTSAEPKFADGNGNSVPSTNYSITDGYAEIFPLPPPTIPPPAQAPETQTLAFSFTGMYGYLNFPEECHPRDVITYELTVATQANDIHLNYFKTNISCNTPTGEKSLYNEKIENKDLPEDWVLNETIRLAVPDDASGGIRCTFDAESYRRFTVCDGGLDFYATSVKSITYEELQYKYDELLSQYNATVEELEHRMKEHQKLNSTYQELLVLYNSTTDELQRWQSEYQKLNSTYQQLLGQHNTTLEQLNSWINEYQKLNATHNQLLSNYFLLNSSYQKLQLDYNSLKLSYDAFEEDYRILNSSYPSLREDFSSLWSSHQELNLNYTNLVVSYETLRYNLSLLQARYDNLTRTYDSLNSTCSSLLETLDSRDEALQREIWLTRLLWFIFLGIAILAAIYIVFSTKRRQNSHPQRLSKNNIRQVARKMPGFSGNK
jgi:hypothetical protein